MFKYEVNVLGERGSERQAHLKVRCLADASGQSSPTKRRVDRALIYFSRLVLPQRFFFLVFTLADFLTTFRAAGLA